VDHAGGSVHHGPTTRDDGSLAGARHPATSGHRGLLVVVREGEGSTRGVHIEAHRGSGGDVAVPRWRGWLSVRARP
jgi:hypothetical protein